MLEKCLNASEAISQADILNPATAADTVSGMKNLSVSRLVVTDVYGKVMHDTGAEIYPGNFLLLPEILNALKENDVFSWYYHAGTMYSKAAAPVYINGQLAGCVYITESDPEQGALIQTLQRNVLWITIILECFVIVFSIVFATGFSTRVRKILSSIRVIRSGDYSHKVSLGGSDELTQLADEFNDLTEKLQASEEQRRQFVSDASHELKTPLASIKLLSDSILQNQMDPDTVREFVEDIGDEAERLNRMSTKLLSLSRAESAHDINFEIVTISPTLERVSRMLYALAEKNNIQIIQKIYQDSPILIQEDDLYQILFNLVENGIKYNTAGGKLTVQIQRVDDNAVVQVIDTGVGIPEESVPHIFERFYRVDKARSRKSGGSGLGLSIVKDMVQRNNGTITVESALGKGTAFTLIFPVFDTEEFL